MHKRLKKYVSDAISSWGADAEVAAVIRDFRESISILELVGLSYEFAHRSFQEYFYAKFVVTDRKLSLEQKIGRLCNKFEFDDTVEMIADMDKTYFEDDFLLPHTKSLDTKLSKIDTRTNPAGVLSKLYTVMHADAHTRGGVEEEVPHIYYTLSVDSNTFILRQAAWKYSMETSFKFETQTVNKLRERIKILKDEYDGTIKIHHRNNAKLKRVSAIHHATQMRTAVSLLRKHLEAKQKKRKQGLGACVADRFWAPSDTTCSGN